MTSEPLTLCAAVSKAEHPVMLAAAQQLVTAVSSALGRDWQVKLVLSNCEGGQDVGPIWIASMIDDVPRGEPIEATMRRWRQRIERWTKSRGTRILLATLFRSVPPPGDRTTVERLRRLNKMALDLSREIGVELIDIDRVFSLCGARTLGTDYRCQGKRAAQIGGHAIAAAIFAGNLDDFLPAYIQDQAARQHGGVHDLAGIAQRLVSTS